MMVEVLMRVCMICAVGGAAAVATSTVLMLQQQTRRRTRRSQRWQIVTGRFRSHVFTGPIAAQIVIN